MKPTIEDRLHNYGNTLDDAAARRMADSARLDDAPVVSLGDGDARARGIGLRRVVAVAAVCCLIVGGAAIVVTRRGHGASPGGSASTTSVAASTSAPTSTTVSGAAGLQTLFTRTTSTGIVIVARAGLVPIAAVTDGAGCAVIPVPTSQPATGECATGDLPGVEFDYSTGGHTFRATVLDRDIPPASGPDLEPMITLADVREILPTGESVFTTVPPPALVVLHATQIAEVRINPARTTATGLDEMAPVDGWVAFAAPASTATAPFDNPVQGLDSAGNVVKTSIPWRCC